MQQKIQKKSFVPLITTSELASSKCLLRTGYFSSTANVLTSCPKIWDVNKREFSNSISLSVINESDQSAVRQFSKVLGNLYHSACPRVL